VKTNFIYQGDNLTLLKEFSDNQIDLIYIDPPFCSQTTYRCKSRIEKDKVYQFQDKFSGVISYVEWLKPRLKEMKRVLKPTGSLFCHLDWRAVHYVKIELDKIFSYDHLVNEIIWCYKSGGVGKKSFARKHDTILFYAKDKKRYLEKFNIKKDEKSYVVTKSGARPITYYNDEKGIYSLVYPKDWWNDCGIVSTDAKHSLDKRTGYPTQKPVKLLQKIIKATTKEGDIVADFFCGSGTTIVAAQSLNRKWIGCDASEKACQVTSDRLKDHFSLFVSVK